MGTVGAVIFALWNRWRTGGNARWLLLIMAVLLLDALVGSTLIAWEIRLLKGMEW